MCLTTAISTTPITCVGLLDERGFKWSGALHLDELSQRRYSWVGKATQNILSEQQQPWLGKWGYQLYCIKLGLGSNQKAKAVAKAKDRWATKALTKEDTSWHHVFYLRLELPNHSCYAENRTAISPTFPFCSGKIPLHKTLLFLLTWLIISLTAVTLYKHFWIDLKRITE